MNYFGNLFEKYFAEILGSTLDKNEYENIPEECREIIKKSLDKKEIIVKEYGI